MSSSCSSFSKDSFDGAHYKWNCIALFAENWESVERWNVSSTVLQYFCAILCFLLQHGWLSNGLCWLGIVWVQPRHSRRRTSFRSHKTTQPCLGVYLAWYSTVLGGSSACCRHCHGLCIQPNQQWWGRRSSLFCRRSLVVGPANNPYMSHHWLWTRRSRPS